MHQHLARVTRLVAAIAAAAIVAVIGLSPATAAAESIFDVSTPRQAVLDPDTNAVELGTRFHVNRDGYATGVRFYKLDTSASGHVGNLWTRDGKHLATVDFTNETAKGWQSATFDEPVHLKAGGNYVVSYFSPEGARYVVTQNSDWRSTHEAISVDSWAGVYRYGSSSVFPVDGWMDSNYWVDVEFTTAEVGQEPAGAIKPQPEVSPDADPTPAPQPSVVPEPTTDPDATPEPSPTPTTEPKPTTEPDNGNAGSKTNCIADPSGCGFADADTTGVRPGVTLKRVPQDITSGPGWKWDSRGWIAADDNAVIQGITTTASIDVFGDNVTIRDTRVAAGGEGHGIGIRHGSNTLIEYVEVGATGKTRLTVGVKDIYGDAVGTVVRYSEVVNTSTGIQIQSGLIDGNYIHSLGMLSGDHVNGITTNGGTKPLTIRGNTILNSFGQTDAIGLFQDFGREANRTIVGNLLAGGGYTIYAGSGGYGTATNIVVSGNRIATTYFNRGGSYGPYTAYDAGGSGNVWSNNVWDHNGSPIK